MIELTDVIFLASVGAGLAVSLPAIASGIGVGLAGAGGAGVIAEKPKEFSTIIILQALPQTAVVFGFVIGLMIVLGMMSGKIVDIDQGAACLGAGIAMGLSGLAAVGMGVVGAASAGAIARNPKTKAYGIILTAMPDLSVLLGFVVAIMMLVSYNVL
ncbi:MAG: hypothetical protein ACXQS2_04860 [Methermicoccaceae archaeon]